MQTTTQFPLVHRPRRMRRNENLRRMARETRLSIDNLVQPLFLVDGEGVRQEIASMPGQYRLSIDELVREAEALDALGIPAVDLFPKIDDAVKTPGGEASLDPQGLYLRAIRAVKQAVPRLLVITDVALDPYSSDGHDGIVRGGEIVNDETLDILSRMAVAHAEAGADVVAPSDMMDGRVAAIRAALDDAGYTGTSILSYTAKYASAFYGPFRDALDSAPRELKNVPKDKKTYQMDPANTDEAVREARLDIEEGADMIMVKPGMPYLDIVRLVRERSALPASTGPRTCLKPSRSRAVVAKTKLRSASAVRDTRSRNTRASATWRRGSRQARPKRDPSSSTKTDTPIGREGMKPRSRRRSIAASADTTPSGPSYAPIRRRCEARR